MRDTSVERFASPTRASIARTLAGKNYGLRRAFVSAKRFCRVESFINESGTPIAEADALLLVVERPAQLTRTTTKTPQR
jgi:hypothetical protein